MKISNSITYVAAASAAVVLPRRCARQRRVSDSGR